MGGFRFVAPASLAQAIAALGEAGGGGVLLAGGTDLLKTLRSPRCPATVVVSLSRVAELDGKVRRTDGGLTVGALATLEDISRDPAVRRAFPALAAAAGKVGSRQIRNRGTLVGNLCNASPAADTVPPLLIHDAVVNIAAAGGARRSLPVERFLVGPGRTALAAAEIVESVFLPWPREASSSVYRKLSRREGVDLAIVGVAAYADDSGEIRLALGAVGPTAFRARAAEAGLRGCGPGAAAGVLARAAHAAAGEASPISDLRASREYRLAMTEVLVENALTAVFDRLGAGKGEQRGN